MTINKRFTSINSVPPVVEVFIPVIVELQVGVIFILGVVVLVVSSVHEVVKLITAVEVTASLTWALFELITLTGDGVPLEGRVGAASARSHDIASYAASRTINIVVLIKLIFTAVSFSRVVRVNDPDVG